MKVLVTGAAGFIGSHICMKFHKGGYEVVGWDIAFQDGTDYRIRSVNLLDMDEVSKNLIKTSPDIIIHCAGSADVSKSVENPEFDFVGNVSLTHNLLFALHKNGMDSLRIIFLSSAGVYGNPAQLPITEKMSLNPLSPYALHKVMCEEMCRYF